MPFSSEKTARRRSVPKRDVIVRKRNDQRSVPVDPSKLV